MSPAHGQPSPDPIPRFRISVRIYAHSTDDGRFLFCYQKRPHGIVVIDIRFLEKFLLCDKHLVANCIGFRLFPFSAGTVADQRGRPAFKGGQRAAGPTGDTTGLAKGGCQSFLFQDAGDGSINSSHRAGIRWQITLHAGTGYRAQGHDKGIDAQVGKYFTAPNNGCG